MRPLLYIPMVALAALLGCGDGADPGPSTGSMVFADSVESFEPGEGAGFGDSGLPGIVLGPPEGKGETQGGLDVLSLGANGSIVLGFSRDIVDGEGPDLVVFENPFYPQGREDAVFAELGAVAVSRDGETWTEFDCQPGVDAEGRWPGCAGWIPTLEFDPSAPDLTATDTGGNAFDLADLGVGSARFVRIRDVEAEGMEPSAGFDLDAVGAFHFE